MRTTTIRAGVALLALIMATAALAQGNTELELKSLADRARARQTDIQNQLAATSDAGERARLEDLSARNSRVIAAYDARLGESGTGAPAAPSGAPAAPSSGGGMFSGIMDKAKGLFGGGDSSNPAGPTAQSWDGSSGGSFSIGSYLKENWPGLVGGMAGSIVGGIVGSRLAGGNKLAGIAGSLVGGWLGQKAGEFLQKKFLKPGGSSGSTSAPPTYAQQQQPATYTTSGGQPQYNAPGVQITYPTGYSGVPPAPQAKSLTEARELMTGRYQSFLAASSNPTLQAQMYQNYMQSKQQYEQMLANARSQQ